jgi:hypothetical protein
VDLIVIGGGCYGCLHTRQLVKAAHRGKIAPRRIVVVDHNSACRALSEFSDEPLVRVVRADWGAFLREYTAGLGSETEDRLIPAPFAPHLLFEWLREAVAEAVPSAVVRRAPCRLPLELPYEHADVGGNQFISAAGWVCPVTCIEPALCPAIKGPRTWELGEIVRGGAASAPEGYSETVLFTCRHFAWGIGAIPVQSLLDARQRIVRALGAGQPQRLIVGTVSSCHGVLATLEAVPVTRAGILR